MAATYILTVAGVERELRLGSLSWDPVIGGADVLTCVILSPNRSYVPALGDSLIVTENGTAIFGGIINDADEEGPDGQPTSFISAFRVTADAFNIYFQGIYITETFAAGTTMASIAQTLVTNYLADFGVTLESGQATGASLTAEMVFDGVLLSEALQRIAAATEYFGRINPLEEFRIMTAGEVAAPVNIVDGDGHHVGDIRVSRSREKNRPAIVKVKYGPSGVVTVTDTFTGNGTQTTFTLSHPILAGILHPFSWQGVVWVDATAETLGVSGSGATWIYDPVAQTITRTSAPANGAAILINYDAQFPQIVTASIGGSPAPLPITRVYEYPNITSKAEAQALADALLAELQIDKTIVRYATYELGIQPGQTQTITAADRGASGSFLLTEMHASNSTESKDVLRQITAIQGTKFRGSDRDIYTDWLDKGTSGTTTIGPALSTGGTGAPAPPVQSVQYHATGGVFGGSSLFLWKGAATYSGFPANLRVEVEDESRYNLALVGPNGTDHWRAQVFGGADIFWDGGRDWNLNPSRDLNCSVGREFIVDIGDNLADAIHLRGIVSGRGFAGGAVRTAASSFTIDTTVATALLSLFCDTTANAITVNLPALASAGVTPSTAQHRVLCVRNDVGGNNVTIDPDASETINGAGTYTLTPGQSVIIQALTGTGAGWKILASHG